MARAPVKEIEAAYHSERGIMFEGPVEAFLNSDLARKYKKRVQLILTSPPFPLNRKKKYGNLKGDEYIQWLAGLAPKFLDLLKHDGSVVMELGNAWEPGSPVMSSLGLKALLKFLESGPFHLCQQFVCYNPARLPTPAQWVNVDRIRVKDAYTHVWWMAGTSHPKADNRKVLRPYSTSMTHLLKTRNYSSGQRPSEHKIGAKSFLKDNGGAIPSNMLTFANTNSNDDYLRFCREVDVKPHPARMPLGLASFFIRFLTDPRNLVMDPFGGSNVTGAAAEQLKRRWITIESNNDYIFSSLGRFAEVKGGPP